MGATAQQVGELSDEQVQQVMGAWLARGRPGEFGQDPAANQRLLRGLLAVDAQQARQALAARRADVGVGVVADAAVIRTNREAQLQAAALDRMVEAGGYTEREMEVAERAMKGEDPTLITTGT